MCFERETKATKDQAASAIARLLAEYGIGRYPASNTAAIINLFSQRWPLLQQLAHQMHDALVSEGAMTADALRPLPEIIEIKNMIDAMRQLVSEHGRRLALNEERAKDAFRMIRRECGEREAQLTELLAHREADDKLHSAFGRNTDKAFAGVFERLRKIEARLDRFFVHQAGDPDHGTFREGDTVTKLTGGPMMTVEKIRGDGLVAVVWYDSRHTCSRDCFAPNTLQKWMKA